MRIEAKSEIAVLNLKEMSKERYTNGQSSRSRARERASLVGSFCSLQKGSTNERGKLEVEHKKRIEKRHVDTLAETAARRLSACLKRHMLQSTRGY